VYENKKAKKRHVILKCIQINFQILIERVENFNPRDPKKRQKDNMKKMEAQKSNIVIFSSDEELEDKVPQMSEKNLTAISKSLPKIGETRLVEYDVEGVGKKIFPGVVLRSEIKNGEEVYMLQFPDTLDPWPVPLEELLLCPIQKENPKKSDVKTVATEFTGKEYKIPVLEVPSESPEFEVSRSRSCSPKPDSTKKILDENFIERERPSLFSNKEIEKHDKNNPPFLVYSPSSSPEREVSVSRSCSPKYNSDIEKVNVIPVVFDIDKNSESENEKELVPVLGDDYEKYFPVKKEKNSESKGEESSHVNKSRKCKQRTHVPRKADEKRTLSSFVGSKMTHMPCGPHGPKNSKRDCWK